MGPKYHCNALISKSSIYGKICMPPACSGESAAAMHLVKIQGARRARTEAHRTGMPPLECKMKKLPVVRCHWHTKIGILQIDVCEPLLLTRLEKCLLCEAYEQSKEPLGTGSTIWGLRLGENCPLSLEPESKLSRTHWTRLNCSQIWLDLIPHRGSLTTVTLTHVDELDRDSEFGLENE